MSIIRKVLLALLAIFIVIQFIRPEENQSAGAMPDDIFAHYPATDNVKQLIKPACYDCHSNNTAYPWYSTIQPVAWWLSDHVKEGKKELNFSEFAAYKFKRRAHKLEEVIEQVKEKEMPLKSYTIIHKDAGLTDQQRKEISEWADKTRKQIIADSLTNKSRF